MEWSSEALYNKARLFMERAHNEPVNSLLFAFWASLSLELLCRSALAKVHPVLLADPREDGNMLYAFGVMPSKPPKSIPIKAIVNRCAALVDGFTPEMTKHCALMADQRNAELHSGTVGFDGFENAAWLPATYEVVEVLLKHLGSTFADLLGTDQASAAMEMLSDRRETVKKEVLDRIAAAKKTFNALPQETRDKLAAQWAGTAKERIADRRRPIRQEKCPSCGFPALIAGNVVSRGPVRIDEASTSIEREVRVLPTKCRCSFCELKLDGFQELRQAGLGSIYTVEETEDPVEFFGIDPADYIDPDEFLSDYYSYGYENE